jgi:hypothetical protein
MTPSSNATLTVQVDNAGIESTVINLTSSDTSQLTVPASVTVPAGQTQVQFTATTTSTASTSATVEASANNVNKYSAAIDF